MKLSVKPHLLKLFALSAGLLGLMLRMVLYATGTDEKGLLIANHWAGITVYGLTAVVVLGLLLLTRSIQGSADYRDAHPRSILAGSGSLVLALAVLMSCLSEISSPPDSIGTFIRWVLGFLTVVSLACICLCRVTGSKPIFLFHGILCVWLALRMVMQYQNWSADPQMQDYVFYLLAHVALMLTAYHQAAFDAGMGSHRSLWYLSLVAVFLCLLSLRDSLDTLLLLAAAFWALTNLTSLDTRPRRQRPALDLQEE